MCVAATPIIGATYTHWFAIAEKDGGSVPKKMSAQEDAALRNEVLGFLISAYWVKGEAQALGVNLSAAGVKKEFDHIRSVQFPKRREFQAFLRSSGQTVADLLFRVELNLLTQRIQRRVVAGHHGAAAQQRALSQFIKGFKTKWQAQTYCTPQYSNPDCGHVQTSI